MTVCCKYSSQLLWWVAGWLAGTCWFSVGTGSRRLTAVENGEGVLSESVQSFCFAVLLTRTHHRWHRVQYCTETDVTRT